MRDFPKKAFTEIPKIRSKQENAIGIGDEAQGLYLRFLPGVSTII